MFDWIRDIVICTMFEEEDRLRIADLLNLLLLIMLAVLIIVLAFQLLVYRAPTEFGQWFTLLSSGILALLIVGLLVLLRRGYVMRVGGLLSLALWVLTTAWIYSSGHLYDLSVTIYFLVVAIAGLTLGGNAALISGFISVVAIVGAYYLQGRALILPPDLSPHPFNLVVTVSVLTVVTLLLRFAVHNTSMALARARRDERVLLERNHELQAIRDALETRTAELQDSNQALQQEIATRIHVEQKLHRYQENLEDLVRERTYELNLATERADQARIVAETANRAKSNFMARVSHEFRTPLTAILGFSQLMLQAPDISMKQRENLEIICRNGENLLALVNDVLDLSRIDGDHVRLNERDIDLCQLLADLEDVFKLRVERKGLQWIFDPSPDLPRYVITDEVKLRRVLTNLLDNAVKFTERGYVRLRVMKREPPEASTRHGVSALEAKTVPITHLVFEIEDTGPGITFEEQCYLFEPFSQIASDRHIQEGKGLGLPISRKFVQCMGGDIVVESEMGQGTRLRFDIRVGRVDWVCDEILAGVPEAQRPAQPRSSYVDASDVEGPPKMISNPLDLPTPWVCKMLRAVTSADFERILDLAEQIRERDIGLADEIRMLVYRFDYAAIQALIES